MNIRRCASSLLSGDVSALQVLAFASAVALALFPACSARVPVGHGQAEPGGAGGSSALAENAAQGGAEHSPRGSTPENTGGANPEIPTAQAGASQVSCTGSLDAVNRALGPACPASLCEASAWAPASCSLRNGVQTTSGMFCADQLRGISFELADGVSKSCFYKANRRLGPATAGPNTADGDLVGVVVTDTTSHFCDGSSNTISAGQSLLPDDCTAQLRWCTRSENNGDAGASNLGAPEEPIRACFNSFSNACEPCCSPTPVDCSDKPSGYPGYRCTVEDGSFCSCDCTRGEWLCGC